MRCMWRQHGPAGYSDRTSSQKRAAWEQRVIPQSAPILKLRRAPREQFKTYKTGVDPVQPNPPFHLSTQPIMKFSPVALLSTFLTAAIAAPFSLPNGFPSPNASSLMEIQKEAGGTLPNTPLPTSLPDDATLTLQVIAANELFEVAYFSNLLDNVTSNADGYTDFGGMTKDYVVESLQAIRAQEELHAIGANAILASAGQKTIGPCNYKFPVSDFKSAVALASTFTDLVLGTLQGAQTTFATDGTSGLIGLVGSIIGEEAEQNGAYRIIQKKVPASAPFLTASVGAFAFNAVNQMFIVPNSCDASSNVSAITGAVPAFKTLELSSDSTPSAKNSTLKFKTAYTDLSDSNNYLAYISGQNAPVVRPITNVQKSDSSATFEAHFPFGAGFSKGLTIASIVKSKGPFANATDVADNTVAGPGLIEV